MDGSTLERRREPPAGATAAHDADTPTFTILPPAAELSGLVAGYWYVRDRRGEHAEARTAPHPAAVLTVHLGNPARADDGSAIPPLSLFGLQSRRRTWLGGPDTCFVMAMITAAGLAELFPGEGAALHDALAPLDALVGAPAATALDAAVRGSDGLAAAARALDAWLLQRRAQAGHWRAHRRYVQALRELRTHGHVAAAAGEAAVSVRHLQRWTRLHAGVTPKQLFDLERLQRSIRRAQLDQSPVDDSYSDESHLIRAWRRRLATTPGRYRRREVSALAREFASVQRRHGSFVAHYL